jgi:holo-[acyl-carrier protein] synthase
MIHGIGMDIVEVARIQKAIRRFGDRLARRILTGAEWEEYQRAGARARFLARRFAVKEALVKALGTGFSDGLAPRQIGVIHDHLGRPGLSCDGPARDRLAALGIGNSHLSITDEREYAAAVVVLERS